MYLKSFKIGAALLIIVCLFSCPAFSACRGDSVCCDRKCCESEMSPDRCRAAVGPTEEISFELPVFTLTAIPVICDIKTVSIPLDIAPDLHLAIENRIYPHTGPPLI